MHLNQNSRPVFCLIHSLNLLVLPTAGISFSSSIAKSGCPDQCGNISIPFPFGIGQDCFFEPSFEIICNTSTYPRKGYLAILNQEIIELNSSRVLVNYPNLGSNCFSSSSNTNTIENRSLIVNLSRTQYTLSDENRITAIGCDNVVVAVVGEDKRTSFRSSCAAICSDLRRSLSISYGTYATCPLGATPNSAGDGCCRGPIPRGNYFCFRTKSTSHFSFHSSHFITL